MSIQTSPDLFPASPDKPAWQRVAVVGAAVIAVVLAVVLIRSVQSGPHFVPRVTVVNPTAFDLDVTVNGPDGSLTLLGVAGRHDNTVFTAVADQGAVWSFHFRAQGQDGGIETLQRHDLQAAAWQITVPSSLASRLSSLGVQPPP